jgi:hypothetical protein
LILPAFDVESGFVAYWDKGKAGQTFALPQQKPASDQKRAMHDEAVLSPLPYPYKQKNGPRFRDPSMSDNESLNYGSIGMAAPENCG